MRCLIRLLLCGFFISEIVFVPKTYSQQLPQDAKRSLENRGFKIIENARSDSSEISVAKNPGLNQVTVKVVIKDIGVNLEKTSGYDSTALLWTEDFEGVFPAEDCQLSGNPTWGRNDYWLCGDCGNYNTWCASGGTNGLDPEYDDYPNNCNSWMIFGPLNLKNTTVAELNFFYWLKSEIRYDWFFYLASADGDTFSGEGISGEDAGTKRLNMNNFPELGNLTGRDSVWIAFAFSSDSANTDKGVFVDNIELYQSNWHHLSHNGKNELKSIFFIDANTGWAAGYGSDYWGPAIINTTDGGENWNPQPCRGTYDWIDLKSVFFIDSNTGWAVGQNDNNDGIVLKTTNGGTNWIHQAVIDSNSLWDVYFVDSNMGWIVGGKRIYINDFGDQILKTTDGGQNWRIQESGIDALLYEVHFVNADMGWAVGMRGTIINTIDGGATWSIQESGGPDVYSVDFIDFNNGWTVNRSGAILKTADGGGSWTYKYPDLPRSDQYFKSVHFADALNGWAVGNYGIIVHTTDGGENWISEVSGTGDGMSFNSVFFIDSNTGWSVGKSTNIKFDGTILYYSGTSLLYPPSNLTASKVENGINLTWDQPAAGNLSEYHVYRSLTPYAKTTGSVIGTTASNIAEFFDTNVNDTTTYYYVVTAVYAEGESAPCNEVSIGNNPPMIANPITDIMLILGGKEFKQDLRESPTVFTDPDGDELLYTVHSLDATVADAEISANTLAVWALKAGATTLTLNANDGKGGFVSQNITVNILPDTSQSIWVRQNSGSTSWLNSVYFVDDQTGWAVGYWDAAILKTEDGGETWISQTPLTSEGFNSVYFVNADTGWIFGRYGAMLKTVDSGVTWNLKEIEILSSISDVYFIDANTGWAVGRDKIIKTTDGGDSWNEQTHPWVYGLNSVYFIDENTGWAAGQSGDVLSTTDGGTTWNEQKCRTSNSLSSIFFIDANRGWVVGNDDEEEWEEPILNTIDGGNTWRWQRSRTKNDLTSVFFLNENNGWAVGENGTILTTSDGGESWGKQDSGTGLALECVYFVNEKLGWAVGQYGTILKYYGKYWYITPKNLNASISENTVILNWDPPSAGDIDLPLTKYFIYQSDQPNSWIHFTTKDSTNDANTTTFSITGLDIGKTYYLTVTALYENHESPPSNEVSVTITDVAKFGTEIPKEFALKQNYPNPFNPTTTIRFDVPKSSTVAIQIYNVLGKKLKTIIDNEFLPGSYKIIWDGKDSKGNQLVSGAYFIRMAAGDFVTVRKILLLK